MKRRPTLRQRLAYALALERARGNAKEVLENCSRTECIGFYGNDQKLTGSSFIG